MRSFGQMLSFQSNTGGLASAIFTGGSATGDPAPCKEKKVSISLQQLELQKLALIHNEITILVPSQIIEQEAEKLVKDFSELLDQAGFTKAKILFKLDEDLVKNHVERSEQIRQIREQTIQAETIRFPTATIMKKTTRPAPKISGQSTTLADVLQGTDVTIAGKVFKTTNIKTKTGGLIHRIYLNDGTDSLVIKGFSGGLSTKNSGPVAKVVEGDQIRALVSIQIDQFERNNLVGLIKNIEIELPPTSTLQTKANIQSRAEFSVHTKMSAYDGVGEAAHYLARAKELQIEAVAFTDRSSVQAFPELQRLAAKQGVRVIYGAELEMISTDQYLALRTDDRILENAEYVVFDLETTGLFPRYAEIIEFGGVKVKNGRIVDRKQLFVKPKKPIPSMITELTKISNADVADAKPFAAI
ncbi:unnamed protein product [Didymodactylos carnosus]|uniref:Polymerase/histidinol phosphatase N-terminal domain-containing protein n=1 Tax=Didymodactylos carnosus TaxID=1234261 RepID=A0A8S2CY55_9BILA|nr:unnamed protein product [Didymodactylos carnosus]CAF3576432.1 unnamed protein product [Didymodactylos carnosus]